MNSRFVCLWCLLVLGWGDVFPALGQELVPLKYRPTVQKGLEWLAKQQHQDGHWEGQGGQFPMDMTGLAGMALSLEGSTTREGKYAPALQRAMGWVLARSQKGGLRLGLLGHPDNPQESNRYLFGHAYAIHFLAQVYGDEEDRNRRKLIQEALTHAVQFSVANQSSHGGWHYTSKGDRGDVTETAVTIPTILALSQARNAGIPVPRKTIDLAIAYLKKSTTREGGIVDFIRKDGQLSAGPGRPALTAGALACLLADNDFKDEHVKKWLKFCQANIPLEGERRLGADAYLHLYYSQVLYRLGNDGWAKLFPDVPSKERLTWNRYRDVMFERLRNSQQADGSWAEAWGGGPVFTTSVHLMILQQGQNEPVRIFPGSCPF